MNCLSVGLSLSINDGTSEAHHQRHGHGQNVEKYVAGLNVWKSKPSNEERLYERDVLVTNTRSGDTVESVV